MQEGSIANLCRYLMRGNHGVPSFPSTIAKSSPENGQHWRASQKSTQQGERERKREREREQEGKVTNKSHFFGKKRTARERKHLHTQQSNEKIAFLKKKISCSVKIGSQG